MRALLLLLSLSARAQDAPPAIGDVSAEIHASSATVSWATDRPADGRVEWGQTGAYGLESPPETSSSASHAAVLSGLAPGRVYHYRVRSRAAGGEAVSSDYTVEIPAAPGAPPPPADAKPPSAVLMSPPPGRALSGVVQVSANAVDDVGVASVQFLLDGAALGPVFSTAPYSYLWNTAAAGDGAHALAASARDAAGNAATSPVLHVTVANAVAVSSAAENASAAAQAADAAAARAPQKLLTPARADGINDAAVFGPAAESVTIADVRGRVVARLSGPAPLVWDCKDGRGRVLESGVYLATIVTRGGGRTGQSFTIAK